MRILVTGGAGFIGRWVVEKLLKEGHYVHVFDNMSNGSRKNLKEFKTNPMLNIQTGDVKDKKSLHKAFSKKPEICIHLAAQINVQESIDDPEKSFTVNLLGTYNVLEESRKLGTKVVIVGTCMVYDMSQGKKINEEHPTNPCSPYAASKLAAEQLALSYYHCYGLPVTILRPFNTYGPFQRTDTEGGVVSVFINNTINGGDVNVFGDGKQTRDLLYVEDCADFIVKAAFSEGAVGQIINAGTGKDVSINELAEKICKDKTKIKHTEHPHPNSEIKRLVCENKKARKLLGWSPTTKLEDGIKKTTDLMKS